MGFVDPLSLELVPNTGFISFLPWYLYFSGGVHEFDIVCCIGEETVNNVHP